MLKTRDVTNMNDIIIYLYANLSVHNHDEFKNYGFYESLM